MGPLNTSEATRGDLIARINTLESKVTELSINEIGLEEIIKALERSNESQAKRVTALSEENGEIKEEVRELSRRVYRLRHKIMSKTPDIEYPVFPIDIRHKLS